MNDLISRKAALDALEWKWAGKAAIDAIKNLPSAEPEQHWIPCSEILPKEGKFVLVCDNDGFICTAEYEVSYDGKLRWYESVEYQSMDDIVAWMPLPEPWRGEDDG